MDIWIHPDANTLADAVADLIAIQLESKPASVFALASGNTPVAVYGELATRARDSRVSFREATVFALDEYLGMGAGDPQSFASYFDAHVFGPIGLPATRGFVPDGRAADPAKECRAFEARILAAGGIDFCLLGVGQNGHLAFNEPGPVLTAQAHIAEIADQTRRAMPSVLRDVRYGLTMGMATILNARRVVLMASGPDKADIITKALVPVIDPWVPASFLQLHPNAVMALDSAAARDLAYSSSAARHAVKTQ
jgi:glucosamine-6-phosphate deaminase